ncbi:hypothetical protein BpHYR1_050244 [Brachionus plicatilis]|uniref:Uncharacterized protein n=1 Tax=Brachionus plicatilis TaxID=10195 RepID=A0A3M7RJR5_BRAPC|nr:hypothetical protein BpHYR1_050244 [Brachionus plicatilis]
MLTGQLKHGHGFSKLSGRIDPIAVDRFKSIQYSLVWLISSSKHALSSQLINFVLHNQIESDIQSSLDNTMCLGGKNGHRINQYLIKGLFNFNIIRTPHSFRARID